MGALDAAVRLTASLDEVAAALAAPDADALLAAEAGLASALAGLGEPFDEVPGDRARLAAELIRARATLARCRILGSSIADTTHIALAAQGHLSDYSRSGAVAPPTGSTRGHRLRTRL